MSIMKVGIIGGSNIATSVHLPLLSCMDDITIEYIAARKNPKILAKLYDAKPIQVRLGYQLKYFRNPTREGLAQ